METQEIIDHFTDPIYFFILKRVNEKNSADDIFQNTFLKVYENLGQVHDKNRIKAWIFQIARNEIANYYKRRSAYIPQNYKYEKEPVENHSAIHPTAPFCCFNYFINELPHVYKETIELIYIKGKRQKEAAQMLNISLANTKARIRRAKLLLKQWFRECCHYSLDENGRLVGAPDCTRCNDLINCTIRLPYHNTRYESASGRYCQRRP